MMVMSASLRYAAGLLFIRIVRSTVPTSADTRSPYVGDTAREAADGFNQREYTHGDFAEDHDGAYGRIDPVKIAERVLCGSEHGVGDVTAIYNRIGR